MDHQSEIQKGIVVMMNSRYVLLKRNLQLVMSLSVVSVFLCCTFTLHYLLSFNYAYFSTFVLSIFTHTLERKYMFLICNAILAFLAKTSLIPSSSSSSNRQEHEDEEHALPPYCDNHVPMLVVPTSMALPQEQETTENDQEEEEEEEEEEAMVTHQDEEEEVEDTSSSIMETNNEDVGNAEELNRKFEEFIRKMKQEIRIEAQTHLITV